MKKWQHAGVLLCLFGLVACESKEDKARKPALIDDIIQTSNEMCFETGQTETRELWEALGDVRSNKLDFLIANNVAVCPDNRLENIDVGFFDRSIPAVFYPGEAPTISLRFDGEDLTAYANNLLSRFPDAFENNPDLRYGEPMVGYSYTTTVNTGKAITTTRHYKWKSATDFDVYNENPQIHTPALNR